MLDDTYIMFARRELELKTRNKAIEKKRVELEQEFNRNKLELEEIYVKMRKVEQEMHTWEGNTHGQN